MASIWRQFSQKITLKQLAIKNCITDINCYWSLNEHSMILQEIDRNVDSYVGKSFENLSMTTAILPRKDIREVFRIIDCWYVVQFIYKRLTARMHRDELKSLLDAFHTNMKLLENSVMTDDQASALNMQTFCRSDVRLWWTANMII